MITFTPAVAQAASALLTAQYQAHEISAETYASLMEDLAIVTAGRRSQS